MDATVEAATTHVSHGHSDEHVVGDLRSGSPARTTHAEGITPVVDADDADVVSVALLSSPGHSVEQVVGTMRASSAPTAVGMESAAETDMALSEVTLAT
jgi:hypothetical protein